MVSARVRLVRAMQSLVAHISGDGVGKGKALSFAIAPEKEKGWVVLTSLFGRRHHSAVNTALADAEREFQAGYSIPRVSPSNGD